MPESADVDNTSHLYLVLDDNDENLVLELVKVDGPTYYVRKNGTWAETDSGPDNERIWDHVIIDVTEEAAEIFDEAVAAGVVEVDAFEDVEILDEEEVA